MKQNPVYWGWYWYVVNWFYYIKNSVDKWKKNLWLFCGGVSWEKIWSQFILQRKINCISIIEQNPKFEAMKLLEENLEG